MSNIINGFYQENSNIFQRFGYHVVLGLKKNLGDREQCKKNILEKIGDVGLYSIEELPKKIWAGMKDPRIVTLALTALALIAASFVFYPVTSLLLAKAAIALIPFPPLWALKFAAYILTVTTIVSASCRAQGRFWNSQLMEQFYKAKA
jgi:hypothetical protein